MLAPLTVGREATAPPLGLNLAGIDRQFSEDVFLDRFKIAHPWTAYRRGRFRDRLLYLASARLGLATWAARLRGRVWQPAGELDVDAYGNVRALAPDQYAEATLWSGSTPRLPKSTLLCRFDGEGDLDFLGDLRIIERKLGELRVEMRPLGRGAIARLNGTNPSNPLRNIRLVPEEFAAGADDDFFYPEFLQRWRGVRVFRFMDWQRTNDSRLVEWADRPTPQDHSQAVKGVALEYMIRLCNRLTVEPWFCMPHAASDDFVRRFAQMVKADLSPSLRIHIEYSNECWNGRFAQTRYCHARGLQRALGGGPGEAQLRFYAQRAVEIFALWEEVFGGSERLVRVLSADAANPWTAGAVLDWQDAGQHADALAIAPYFGARWGNPQTVDAVAAMGPDDLIRALHEDVAASAEQIKAHAAEAGKRGLTLAAYEGGQHLVGYGGAENDDRLTRLFVAVNRHPGMDELYRQHLRNWSAAGGGLFCLFTSMSVYDRWGCWGLIESGGQAAEMAPKYRAVREFLEH